MLVPGGGQVVAILQEQPARTWALMSVLNFGDSAVPPLQPTTVVQCEFLYSVSVGSTQMLIERTLSITGSASLLGNIHPFVVDIIPATNIILVRSIIGITTEGPGQLYPLTFQIGSFAAPQFPFVQSLELTE